MGSGSLSPEPHEAMLDMAGTQRTSIPKQAKWLLRRTADWLMDGGVRGSSQRPLSFSPMVSSNRGSREVVH